MYPKSKQAKVVLIGTGAVLVILASLWWINGAELKDAWLYLSSAAVVVTSAWGAYPKQ